MLSCEAGDNGGGHGGGGGSSSGLRLFGVQVRIAGGGGGAGSAASMKKSYSMDCLQLGAPGCSSLVSPSPSPSSSSSLLLSIEEGLERGPPANGYLSDGPHGRVVQERKKGTSRQEASSLFFIIFLMMKRQKRKICCFFGNSETRISFLIGSIVHQSDLKKVASCFTFLVKESCFIFFPA